MITRIDYGSAVYKRTATIIFVKEGMWSVHLFEKGTFDFRSPTCSTLTSAQGKARAWVNGWLGRGRKRR